MIAAHRLRRNHRADDGLTLIELVVAMGIASILIALVAMVFTSTARGFSDQQGAIDNSRLASTAMNEVTRVVRAGTEIPRSSGANIPVFLYAGAERIDMNSFIDSVSATDPAPLRVRFGRNARNELVETRWAGTHIGATTYWQFSGYPATPSSTRTIARSLLAPSTAVPLFRYFDKDGAQLTPPAGGTLSTAQIANIAAVQVTMQVQADESGRVDPVVIQNLVGLPNLGIARVEVD